MEEQWLRFNKEAKLAFIDVETFNLCLNFQVNRPWQVSVLKVIGETIVEEIDLFVKWEDCKFKIGEGAAAITRFNQSIFDSKAIGPDEAFHKFWPTLQWADHIIFHNGLRFDLYLLKGYAEFMGEDWSFILPKSIDTKAVAQGIKLGRPFRPATDNWIDYCYSMCNDRTRGIKTRLETLASESGIFVDKNRLHDGLYDLKVNKQVWDNLKHQLEL